MKLALVPFFFFIFYFPFPLSGAVNRGLRALADHDFPALALKPFSSFPGPILLFTQPVWMKVCQTGLVLSLHEFGTAEGLIHALLEECIALSLPRGRAKGLLSLALGGNLNL